LPPHKNGGFSFSSAFSMLLKSDFDIIRDSDFRTSNIILDSTLKMMVKTGLSQPTKHKEIIDL
jgi:hypothetical protein